MLRGILMAENDGLKLHPKKTHDLTPCSDPFLTNDESFFAYFAEVSQRFLAGCGAGFSQTGKERGMLPDATLRSEMARKEKGERGLRASLRPPPFSLIDTESFPPRDSWAYRSNYGACEGLPTERAVVNIFQSPTGSIHVYVARNETPWVRRGENKARLA
ncbi:hypothetical protein K0M31_017950 [Melipona bicolor]|uniref:Uncharacterized protein n=1 Tax=Melipona bicolor TaxID=60889 RepID=A0AA40G5U3_9HYME|nr:hypothetical protein K0M31_017950 [Melipona bicolor]